MVKFRINSIYKFAEVLSQCGVSASGPRIETISSLAEDPIATVSFF